MPGMMATAAAVSTASSAAGSSSSARPSPRASSSRTKTNGHGNGNSTGTSTPNPATGGASTPSSSMPAAYQSAPLSSRKAQALDMSTVETRVPGVKDTPKQMRPHGLQEAPTFYPTLDEWKDPMDYIKSISEEGSKYGIVKIVPPDSWMPDFGVDTERFHFRTRRQELNSVEGGTRANLNYLDQLAKFHKQHGTTLNRFPSVDKKPLDLYRLKKAVDIRGGFNNVCKGKKWAEIGRDLGYSGKIMSSLSTSLKNSYSRYLHPYEEWAKTAKPSVQAAVEAEFGPITPSPANSPAKKPLMDGKSLNSPISMGPDSPAIRASSALTTSVSGTPDNRSDVDMADATPIKLSTPLQGGGFTPVNAGNGFTPVNIGPSGFNGDRTSDTRFSTPSYRPNENGISSKRGSPEGSGSPLKRVHVDVPNGTSNGKSATDADGATEENESGERRSKRLKKEPAPMVAGSHMTLHKPSSVPRNTNDRKKNEPGEKCEKCGKGDDMVKLLLCDGCDYGYHIYCLEPPLKAVPERDWYCDRCLVGTGEYGFADGEIYSLRQFQEKANNFKENYFASKTPFDPVKGKPRPVTEDDVEREFWRLVETLQETVEVEYGADIHSTTHGSGFPTIERHPTNPYSTDPWNLTLLPLHPESLFRHIKSDVSGMTVPWLYVGMCFSTFCWHNEDHFTYSANYQHFGETKTWYGIPGEDAEKFEQAMKEAVPELFEQQPDLLFQLVTLLTPQHLMKAGVRVFALDQRAGQFVITFPKAYHAGFNHGFNFNEAVNFAPADWEPFGQEGVERYKAFRRAPVFSHDELLLTAAGRDTSIKTAQWLAPALQRVMDREFAERSELLGKLPDIKIIVHDEELEEDDYQCTVCKVYCYLSQVICSCTSNVGCPTHFRDICDCDSSKLTLRLKMTNEALEELVLKVHDRANLPKAWAAKLEKTMIETPRPQLKVLKSLLTEGEKIPFFIPETVTLKAYVDKCQEWVEEAMPFVSRKQQNRRKNEKAWRKGSAKAQEMEEKEKEHRSLDSMLRLLQQADDLCFECPEMDMLTERANAIRDFQMKARKALATPGALSTTNYEEMVDTGKSFNVDLEEAVLLEKIVKQLKWVDEARDKRNRPGMTLDDVDALIKTAKELAIPDNNDQFIFLQDQRRAGEMWETKVKELLSAESIHYQQLDALSGQASTLPVSKETLAKVDQILSKQREAQKRILALYEASKSPIFAMRPKYKDVREVLEELSELHSKPNGTIDLEKEQKRHEDWMRRGKKLFGKANAPLHILHQHMTYVEMRNQHCFALDDRPRTPVEPSSREPTPENNDEDDEDDEKRSQTYGDSSRGRPREVFCICRQPEAGMMIECEVCHEWYHGKCLKIARGKVKEDDKYTCPICDYRVKIPRDAARPKLEDLMDWQSEIPTLPFIPDELDCLTRIIDAASKFRQFVSSYTNSPLGLTSAEVPTMRFYLRKIEGAEILLAHETNFFRAELHKWMPIAPEPPPPIEISVSTRKPRPTKQQKLMAQMGIKNPEDLPAQFRTKPHTFKKKQEAAAAAAGGHGGHLHQSPNNQNINKPATIKPAPMRGTSSPTPSNHSTPDPRHTPHNHPQHQPRPIDYSLSRFTPTSTSSQNSHHGFATAQAMLSNNASPSPMLNGSHHNHNHRLDPALFSGGGGGVGRYSGATVAAARERERERELRERERERSGGLDMFGGLGGREGEGDGVPDLLVEGVGNGQLAGGELGGLRQMGGGLGNGLFARVERQEGSLGGNGPGVGGQREREDEDMNDAGRLADMFLHTDP